MIVKVTARVTHPLTAKTLKSRVKRAGIAGQAISTDNDTVGKGPGPPHGGELSGHHRILIVATAPPPLVAPIIRVAAGDATIIAVDHGTAASLGDGQNLMAVKIYPASSDS